MAEKVLSNVVGQILGWLGSSAAHEIGSIWRVHDDLEDLNHTLSAITAVLLDSDKHRLSSDAHRFHNWLHRLENVVYIIDDLVDEFSTDQALRRQEAIIMRRSYRMFLKEVSAFFSSSNQFVSQHKMALRVKKLRRNLDKIAADRRDFNLEQNVFDFSYINNNNNNNNRILNSHRDRDTHSSVIEENIVGREGDKFAILELVLNARNEESHVSVIPIVGIGGLGKTALAQLVFNDDTVCDHFDIKIWLWVSVEFDVKSLVEKIVVSVDNVCPKSLELEQLQRRLHGKINNKRCLLVLDDVWNENREKWESLRDLLAKEAKECRVLVTTRSEKVAKLMGTVKPYGLKNLGEDNSWSLFKKMAFGREQEPTSFSVAEIGKKIVKKCGGIPLAIKAVGGMLHFKNPESEWLPFVQKELLEMSQNGNLDNMVLQTLRLSYDHLPSHLKHCFAYCSLFPKGYSINVEMLIGIWMAHGFFNSLDPGEDLEEQVREYFMELLWRSFFQEVERDNVSGNIKTCKMHDLMHDLAVVIAGRKCVVLGQNGAEIGKETYHLSIHFHLDSLQRIPVSWTQAKRVRSILLPSQSFRAIAGTFSKSFCQTVIRHFRFVRVLELKKLGITMVPESIGVLRHLRYLDLSFNWDIHILPGSITKLFNLQTLKLNHCHLRELPRDIKRLVNLRHLEIRANRLIQMPSGLGQLTKLRTLSEFILSEEQNVSSVLELNELVRLNNLRGLLVIKNLRHGMESNGASFKDKSHLQSLHLHWCRFDVGGTSTVDHNLTLEGLHSVPNLRELRLENYKAVDFPCWFVTSFSNLIKFELDDCVNCQHLPPLSQFRFLRMLKLHNMPKLEYITRKCITMPSLQNLELYYLPNVKGWCRDAIVAEDESSTEMGYTFPCLSSLRIFNCPKLTSMPLYPFVEELVLEKTSWKPLQKTIMKTVRPNMTTEEAASSSSSNSFVDPNRSFPTLPRLRSLVLGGNEDLQPLPTHLGTLTSLKELHISNCSKLRDFSSSIEHLALLETLKVKNCEELDISNDGAIRWELFTSLRCLSFNRLPKLASLPEGLQHVTTLYHLEISRCTNFKLIPEWIRNFGSLATLEIWECPNLVSLPDAISKMPSIETLIIYDCPTLLQRCQRGGEDWPKIVEIPVVDLW